MKKLLGILVAVLLIGSLSVAKAEAFTLDDLMGQIATLRTEVAQLKGNLGAQAYIKSDSVVTTDSKESAAGTGVSSTGNTSTESSSFVGNPGYWILDGENKCVLVQIRPTKSVPCTQQSDSFGSTSSQTETARANSGGYWILNAEKQCVFVKIRPTGSVGCTSSTAARALTFGDAKSVDVLNLQIALKNSGFLSATPNGTFGPATRTAVMALQKAKGLPVTGVADVQTVASIDQKKASDADVDAFIAGIPKKIAELQKQIDDLQAILKDPAAYKARMR